MEMYFWLLKQKHWRRILTQQLSNNWQNLADAVTHVNQISPRANWLAWEFSDLYLKRAASFSSKGLDGYFVE